VPSTTASEITLAPPSIFELKTSRWLEAIRRHTLQRGICDPASTDWRHLGRLAGFTNQKPALSENLTERPLLRNFLHPLNRKEPTLVTAIRLGRG